MWQCAGVRTSPEDPRPEYQEKEKQQDINKESPGSLLVGLLPQTVTREQTHNQDIKVSPQIRRQRRYLIRRFTVSSRVTEFLILPASEHDRILTVTGFLDFSSE